MLPVHIVWATQVVSRSQEKYEEAFATWWRRGDADSFCDARRLSTAARQVASAAAEVLSSAKSGVVCEGQGEACGYSLVNGGIEHSGVIAEAIVQAAASVVGGSPAGKSFCYADLRAASVAITQSAELADQEICESGSGNLQLWKDSFLTGVQFALEDTLAAATSVDCMGEYHWS